MNEPAAWQQAVVDRVVDGKHAVLLVGPEEVERVVPARALPGGAAEGSWLRVRFAGEELLEAVLDLQETEQRRARIMDKLARLRQRGRQGPAAGDAGSGPSASSGASDQGSGDHGPAGGGPAGHV